MGRNDYLSLTMGPAWAKQVLHDWKARGHYVAAGDPQPLPRKQGEAPLQTQQPHGRTRSEKERS